MKIAKKQIKDVLMNHIDWHKDDDLYPEWVYYTTQRFKRWLFIPIVRWIIINWRMSMKIWQLSPGVMLILIAVVTLGYFTFRQIHPNVGILLDEYQSYDGVDKQYIAEKCNINPEEAMWTTVMHKIRKCIEQPALINIDDEQYSIPRDGRNYSFYAKENIQISEVKGFQEGFYSAFNYLPSSCELYNYRKKGGL